MLERLPQLRVSTMLVAALLAPATVGAQTIRGTASTTAAAMLTPGSAAPAPAGTAVTTNRNLQIAGSAAPDSTGVPLTDSARCYDSHTFEHSPPLNHGDRVFSRPTLRFTYTTADNVRHLLVVPADQLTFTEQPDGMHITNPRGRLSIISAPFQLSYDVGKCVVAAGAQPAWLDGRVPDFTIP